MARLAFFGTPDFAVPSLEALLESDHEVALVVCQPDRPKGRGKKMQAGQGACSGRRLRRGPAPDAEAGDRERGRVL